MDLQELRDAIPLQVHRKTDYPPMADQLRGVFSELVEFRRSRGQQIRKAKRVREHLKAVILDLWIAANYSDNPYRAVSRNRNNFTKETRYRKIFLKYDLLIGVIDDLVSLGYLEQKKGFYDRIRNRGYQSRIKATDKLLSILNFNIKEIVRNPDAPEDETIIIKDADGEPIDYIDDRFTIEMREFLKSYNQKLRGTNIGTDAIDLRYKYDPTAITVKRIFNVDRQGGRFYGGFWENMPKLDRLKLLLESGPVCELDYSALHPTLAYAGIGIELNSDPYLIEGCERSEVKSAFLVLFNCRSRQHAINTIRSEFHVTNAESLIEKIEQKHEAIKATFYNPPYGMYLQNTDAWLAERVMKRLLEDDILCLPIHDSFIVAKQYEDQLYAAMEVCFFEIYSIKPRIK
ncbi:MAG TPA: hypothetical protein VHB01_03885 [Nitrosospira sp.]|nr:hypothetical protein [Nitrosospira sp.]